MNTDICRKLDMADRVREFNRTHPADNPGHAAVIARFAERVARANALARQERAGHLAVRAAVATKAELRREIHFHLGVLQGTARAAAREESELATRFRLPRSNANHLTFLTIARVSAAQATESRALLTRYGLPESFLDELDGMIDRYEQAAGARDAGRLSHVGANADLTAVAEEILGLVHLLDALNRHRYRGNAEPLAGWKSARDIAWPRAAKAGAAADIMPMLHLEEPSAAAQRSQGSALDSGMADSAA